MHSVLMHEPGMDLLSDSHGGVGRLPLVYSRMAPRLSMSCWRMAVVWDRRAEGVNDLHSFGLESFREDELLKNVSAGRGNGSSG